MRKTGTLHNDFRFKCVQAEKPGSPNQQDVSPQHAGVYTPRRQAAEFQTETPGQCQRPVRPILLQARGPVLKEGQRNEPPAQRPARHQGQAQQRRQ